MGSSFVPALSLTEEEKVALFRQGFCAAGSVKTGRDSYGKKETGKGAGDADVFSSPGQRGCAVK